MRSGKKPDPTRYTQITASQSARRLPLTEAGRQAADGQAGDGIDHVPGHLGEWRQHERPVAESWMRHDQTRLIEGDVSVQNQIEIQSSGGVSCCPDAAARAFQRLQRSKQGPWPECGEAGRGGVQYKGWGSSTPTGAVSMKEDSVSRSTNAASAPAAQRSEASRSPRLLPSAMATRTGGLAAPKLCEGGSVADPA